MGNTCSGDSDDVGELRLRDILGTKKLLKAIVHNVNNLFTNVARIFESYKHCYC